MKVVKASKVATPRTNITLNVYVVTDDGRNSMTVTIFENLTESMKLGKSYKVHNLLLTFF